MGRQERFQSTFKCKKHTSWNLCFGNRRLIISAGDYWSECRNTRFSPHGIGGRLQHHPLQPWKAWGDGDFRILSLLSLLGSGLSCMSKSRHVWTWNNHATKRCISCQLDRGHCNNKWMATPKAWVEGLAAATTLPSVRLTKQQPVKRLKYAHSDSATLVIEMEGYEEGSNLRLQSIQLGKCDTNSARNLRLLSMLSKCGILQSKP